MTIKLQTTCPTVKLKCFLHGRQTTVDLHDRQTTFVMFDSQTCITDQNTTLTLYGRQNQFIVVLHGRKKW